MDPISELYLNVINEATIPDQKVSTNLKVGAAFGDSSNEKNTSTFIKGSGPEVENVEDPEEAPDELTCDVDSSAKKLAGVKEANNPFDALYNKIVSEEGSFNFSTDQNNELSLDDLNDDVDSTEDDSEVDEFADDQDDSEEITITLNKELALELIDILKAAVGDSSDEEGSEEDEEGSEEDEEGSEEDEGESEDDSAFGSLDANSDEENKPYPESFVLDDAEELGEPLVDAEKLSAGLNNPKNYIVKGSTIKASKKSAETPKTGKHSDGKLKPHNTKTGVSKLTNKKQQVDSQVKTGKSLFEVK